jgi:hypothetical protein
MYRSQIVALGMACLCIGLAAGCNKRGSLSEPIGILQSPDGGPATATPMRYPSNDPILSAHPVDVFLDQDREKPFLKGAMFAGVVEIDGERFVKFVPYPKDPHVDPRKMPEWIRYVKPSRIFFLQVNKQKEPVKSEEPPGGM